MLISLDSVPIVPLGMENRGYLFDVSVSQSRICSSLNSCAPPPRAITTPTSRWLHVHFGGKVHAGILQRFRSSGNGSGTRVLRCLALLASIHLDSSKSSISPAIAPAGRWHGTGHAA